MDRRDFIQAITAAFAAYTLPAIGKPPLDSDQEDQIEESWDREIREAREKSWSNFDPSKNYGKTVVLTTNSDEAVEFARDALLKNARESLPPGTRFYVLHNNSGSEYGEGYFDVSWYYTPKLSDEHRALLIGEVIA